ncbi:MAG: hypothetical protein LC808_35425 [Actinobacteria bacterium]|nr:hypothetical protein [Actinomycetota bacterium]
MPLDIRVEGDAGGLRATGHWLRTMQQSVHDVGTDIHGARADSEWGWSGDAGSGFRESMGRAATAVDGLAVDFGATARALDTHADDLDTVTSRMNQAVDIARAGGLRTTGDTIFEPGPAPAEPAALPTTRPATEAEQSMHAQATAAQGAYVRQVVAYQQAGQVVVAARGIETASQRALNSFLAGFVEKLPFTITDFATGLAGAVAARTSTLRARADRFDDKAARAARLLDSDNLSRRNWLRAAVLHAENTVDARAARAQATVGYLARYVNRLPPGVKRFLSANVDYHGTLKSSTPVLGKTLPVLRRVPVVGGVITALGIGYDIGQGRNPVKSTVSGVSSLAAGAAVGAAIGGPVGVVVGGVVGVGVGFVVDEWGDDIARGAADLGEGADID